MLKALLKDVPILDGYLHDSYFKSEEIAFNADDRTFTMDLERPSYEQAKRGKALFFIPVVRYPWVRARLAIKGVEAVERKRIDKGVDGPDGKLLLMDIEQTSENTVVLRSAHFEVTLTVASDLEVILVDEPEPAKSGWNVDFGKGIFCGMDEVDKLKVDSDPTNPLGFQ